jgi:hypothetical protein
MIKQLLSLKNSLLFNKAVDSDLLLLRVHAGHTDMSWCGRSK